MGVLELHNAHKYCVGAGVGPQARISLHTTSLKGCFRMPTMGELHNAPKYCVGAGVAPQAPIPLHSTSQKGYVYDCDYESAAHVGMVGPTVSSGGPRTGSGGR